MKFSFFIKCKSYNITITCSLGYNLCNYPEMKYFIKLQLGKIIHQFPKNIKNAVKKTPPINSVGSIEKVFVYMKTK